MTTAAHEPAARVLLCRGTDSTRRLGQAIGERLGPGDLVGLAGPLGAGKTVLVQGLALGLGVPPRVRVCSPTYTYANEYRGRLPLVHVDLYRVETADDLEAIGYRDLAEGEGVCAVEWIDRLPEARPPAWLSVRLELVPGDDEARRVVLEAVGGCGASALSRLPEEDP